MLTTKRASAIISRPVDFTPASLNGFWIKQIAGSCLRGENCHFAHGEADLRRRGDPLPLGLPMVKDKNMQQPSFPASNFKTVMCRFYDKGNSFISGILMNQFHLFRLIRALSFEFL
jgi:hypothetical protein